MTSRALSLINGIGRMITVSSLSAFYDEKITYNSTVTAGTNITLPSSGEYTGVDLRVFLSGIFLEPGQDYTYVGTAPRTQIQILVDIVAGDTLRFRRNLSADPVYIYDQVVTGSNITAGNNITLPLSKTYNDAELEVYLGGQLLQPVIDYNYVGTIPRSQIVMTFDIYSTDRLRFRSGD
jgi:hypothetical protein